MIIRFLSQFLCLLLLCALLVACGRTHIPRDPFVYTTGSFTADVRGSICRTASDGYTGDPTRVGQGYTGQNIDIAARVTVEDTNGARRVSVSFSEPATLAGVTVIRTECKDANGDTQAEYTISRGIQSFSDSTGAFEGLTSVADAFFPIGDITSATPVTDGTYTVTVESDASEGASAIFQFQENVALPVRIQINQQDRNMTLLATPA